MAKRTTSNDDEPTPKRIKVNESESRSNIVDIVTHACI
jgi:hypothetical protein